MTDLKPILETLRDLNTALTEADEAQWQAPPHPRDESGVSSNKVADPTSNIATDPQRLRLRLAVMAAERQLDTATQSLTQAVTGLDKALDEWKGKV